MKDFGYAVVEVKNSGRVYIPEEIRRYVGIDAGTQLEIHVTSNGDIVLSKYDQRKDYIETLQNMASELKRKGLYDKAVDFMLASAESLGKGE